MLRHLLTLALVSLFFSVQAQNDYYFPPATGATWETVDPAELGWCTDQIDSLVQFLDDRNSKGFIILHRGKIALETYFDSFTQDSLWYWASASKTLTAFLTGVAQEEGWLSIDAPTADYLGTGWTSAPPEKEELITVYHQLSMSSGLDDGIGNVDCTDPACLQYLADAGTRWAYHNAPYTLIQAVIENASGLSINQFTNTRLKSAIGMGGLWVPVDYNSVFFSRPRDMARFGSLMLNDGVWDGDTLLSDLDYMEAMRTPSQGLNESYGYLWWLNGQDSYLLPQSQITFPGPIIPAAPADLYAGLGKNDQKLYIVPSLDLVVIRMGNAAGGIPLLSLSSFDNLLWERIMQVVDCTPNRQLNGIRDSELVIFPNPTRERLRIRGEFAMSSRIEILDQRGREVLAQPYASELSVGHLPPGLYLLRVITPAGVTHQGRFLRQ